MEYETFNKEIPEIKQLISNIKEESKRTVCFLV